MNKELMIKEAVGLFDFHHSNDDYERGICELIARLYPVIEQSTGERASDIMNEIINEGKNWKGVEL